MPAVTGRTRHGSCIMVYAQFYCRQAIASSRLPAFARFSFLEATSAFHLGWASQFLSGKDGTGARRRAYALPARNTSARMPEGIENRARHHFFPNSVHASEKRGIGYDFDAAERSKRATAQNYRIVMIASFRFPAIARTAVVTGTRLRGAAESFCGHNGR